MPSIFTFQNRWLVRTKLVRMIQNEHTLPALPEIIQRLDGLMMDSDTEISKVVELLETEPVVVGRVLGLANSALYSSGRHKAQSIQMAVQRLGYHTVRSLLYAAKLPDLFLELPPKIHMHFWEHSLTVGLLARYLILSKDEQNTTFADHAYLAGLLHDIGVLLLLEMIPDEYTQLLTNTSLAGLAQHHREQEHFGIEHAELGAMYIARHWNLSEEVVTAVKIHHHYPTHDDQQHAIQNAVYVANVVCNIYNYRNGFSDDPVDEHLTMLASLADLGFNSKRVETLLKLASDSVGAIRGMLTN